VAERAGFEPAVAFEGYDGLANRCFRPLSHLSPLGRRLNRFFDGLARKF
jgi:hypothetical protein